MAYVPYPYGDPLISVSLAAYGPQAVNQPHMMPPMLELASARVALPLDLAEGPIYVNAKQYHGILRRRQLRAKLEAENKLVKIRKPYLHESRHRHALNRVRGSGGRFLSTKQLQQSDTEQVTSAPSHPDPIKIFQKHDASELKSHHLRTGKNTSSITSCSDMMGAASNSDSFRQLEPKFLGNSADMGGASQCNGVLTLSGTQQRASVVS